MPRVGRAWSKPASSGSDQSEDEIGDGDQTFQGSIFQGYLKACSELSIQSEQEDAFQRGMGRVKEYLAGGGEGGICLICLSAIRPKDAVWDCQQGCFCMFHLPCIQEWARNQLDAAEARAATRLNPANFPAAAAEARSAAEWACPKCREPYPSTAIPRTYTCFCGKLSEPTWDPWLAPHTCGEICGRQLPGGCRHSCLLLCHPGPCPPCPLVVPAACPCGKKQTTRRCGAPEPSCGAPCQRALPCGHRCRATCHEGACPPCPLTAPATCPCGSENQNLPCSQRTSFRCHRECSKLLACGRHHCTQVCHGGPCGGCPSSGPRTCPCGKQTYTDLQCDERAPTCGDTCGLLLQCGRHYCTERCHHGPCTATCRATVSKLCRCGKSAKAVQCGEEVRCDRRCGQMRSCGRHPCRRRCCDGDCPPCEETCGKKLRCGNHKCPAPCHLGPCRPCPLTTTVTCGCARTSTTLPCGAESQAVPPRCFHPCPVPPLCRHARSLKPHRCHFGACPTCPTPCSTPLPCGHLCASPSCHDLPPPDVPPFAPPKPSKNALANAAPPPAPASSAIEAAKQLQPSALTPCLTCQAPITIPCLGGHTTQQLPCSSLAPFACPSPCGQPLACGNHTCPLPCHVPEAPSTPLPSIDYPPFPNPPTPTPCQQCTLSCSKPRPCPHPCPLSCHTGACPACTQPLKTTCHCGKTPLTLPCHQHQLLSLPGSAPCPPPSPELAAAAAQLLCGKPCSRPFDDCPHACKLPCHPGSCEEAASCGEQVPVRCSCRTLKEYWPCHRVRQQLAATGQAPTYGPATPLRLLLCTATCAAAAHAAAAAAASAAAAAAVGKGGKTGDAGASAADGKKSGGDGVGLAGLGQVVGLRVAQAAKGVGGALAAVIPGAAGGQKTAAFPEQEGEAGKKAKRLTREERERQAAERAEARQRADQRRKMVAMLRLAGVVGVGVALTLLLFWLMQRFDEQATAKWQPKDEL